MRKLTTLLFVCFVIFGTSVLGQNNDELIGDYGDAPSSTSESTGGFPTIREGSEDPNFIIHRFPEDRVYLGETVTVESNGLVINEDIDDGWLVAQSFLTCTVVQLNMFVTVPEDAVEGPIYFNALFDWNMDGAWGGASSCTPTTSVPSLPAGVPTTPVQLGSSTLTPEWAIQNIRLDQGPYNLRPGFSGPILLPSMLVGSEPGEMWIRYTISTEPVNDKEFTSVVNGGTGWDGRGDFVFGKRKITLRVFSSVRLPHGTVTSAPSAHVRRLTRRPYLKFLKLKLKKWLIETKLSSANLSRSRSRLKTRVT